MRSRCSPLLLRPCTTVVIAVIGRPRYAEGFVGDDLRRMLRDSCEVLWRRGTGEDVVDQEMGMEWSV